MAYEQIADGVFRIEVPLPQNPLKELNAYLVLGSSGGRNLLIDTGFNRPECLEAITGALTGIGVSMADTDLFITHMHADHSGLVSQLARENTRIYASRTDGTIINLAHSESYWISLIKAYQMHGFPNLMDDAAARTHPGFLFGNKKDIDFTYLDEGDILEVGPYRLRPVHTPGHTPGHLCLYDEQAQLLFAGDHILGVITPSIVIDLGHDQPLTDYLASLDKVAALPIRQILTAHRATDFDAAKRIEDLKDHHAQRLDEIVGILGDGQARTAYQTAQLMKWRIRAENWEAFPPQQKWFATGEAMAHLLHLHKIGAITRYRVEDRYCYSI